jgi:hypothetical protein
MTCAIIFLLTIIDNKMDNHMVTEMYVYKFNILMLKFNNNKCTLLIRGGCLIKLAYCYTHI